MKLRHAFSCAAFLGFTVSISISAAAITIGEPMPPAPPDTTLSDQPEPATVAMPGDCNHDGVVDFSDYLVLEANFGKPGDWKKGDFSGDGMVQYEDYLILRDNYGMTYEKWSNSVVPEPLTVLGLLLAAAACLRIVRRTGV